MSDTVQTYQLPYTAEELETLLNTPATMSADATGGTSLQTFQLPYTAEEFSALTTKLDMFMDIDDDTLDQLSEVIDMLRATRQLVDGIKIPTKVSELENDNEYLTSYTETDPTVPAWAKAETKPGYTKSEVGLSNVDNVKQYSADNPPPYPVTSVNNKTGAVTLSASDVGAALSSHNHNASNISSGTLPVSRGGTGITSTPALLTNLGSTSSASIFAASPRPGVTGTLPIANGGTGATSAAAARSKLGLTGFSTEKQTASSWISVGTAIATKLGSMAVGDSAIVMIDDKAGNLCIVMKTASDYGVFLELEVGGIYYYKYQISTSQLTEKLLMEF